jgi:hypothetical protein
VTEEDQGRSRDREEEYPFLFYLPLASKSLDITLLANDALILHCLSGLD